MISVYLLLDFPLKTIRFQCLSHKDCNLSLGKEEIGVPCIEENSQMPE